MLPFDEIENFHKIFRLGIQQVKPNVRILAKAADRCYMACSPVKHLNGTGVGNALNYYICD